MCIYFTGQVITQNVSKDDVGREKTHFQLAKALGVLKINASTFHSLYVAKERQKVKL